MTVKVGSEGEARECPHPRIFSFPVGWCTYTQGSFSLSANTSRLSEACLPRHSKFLLYLLFIDIQHATGRQVEVRRQAVGGGSLPHQAGHGDRTHHRTWPQAPLPPKYLAGPWVILNPIKLTMKINCHTIFFWGGGLWDWVEGGDRTGEMA